MHRRTPTVLITGCSDGSLGSALAHAFHDRDVRVLASARDLVKVDSLKTKEIECIELDALSADSINLAVAQVSSLTGGRLDMLVNSVGGGHYMPFMHLDLQKARSLFEVNVWSFLEVTQAFLPLLLKAADPTKGGNRALIVNNSSISSVLRTPYHSAYSASKAAMAAFNDIQRIELSPLGINVVDPKTGSTKSNFQENKTNTLELPEDSPYQAIKEDVMNVITGNATEAYAEEQKTWAEHVVSDLLRNPDNPPAQIWRGGAAGTVKAGSTVDALIPAQWGDKEFQKLGGLDKLAKQLARE